MKNPQIIRFKEGLVGFVLSSGEEDSLLLFYKQVAFGFNVLAIFNFDLRFYFVHYLFINLII
jgi:hypothetical protein